MRIKTAEGVHFADENLIYYGPHPCQRCDSNGKKGTMIVKASKHDSPRLEFNFTHDSHYPNHVWDPHDCPALKSHE